jgi:hypothetical protein
MFQTIVDAMRGLGDAGLVFGLTDPQKGENEFQKELGRTLEQMTEADGWRWRYSHRDKEERFKTEALTNREAIAIDVVGRHDEKGTVAVELKYVPAPPKDKPALPYDVAKDCLKLDLLRAGHCTPANSSSKLPAPDSLQTYVIALTDWSHYWEGTKSLAWATSFADAMRTMPICFEGIMRTTGGNPENTVFKQRRCHVALGRAWCGGWTDYSSRNEAKAFRYLLLRPPIGVVPKWAHHEMSITEQSEIIPFLNKASREEFNRRKLG